MKGLSLLALVLLAGCELIVHFDPPPESGEQCTDGLDNDGNGFVDCRDPGCASAPGCRVGPDAGTSDAGTPDGPPITPNVCGNGVVDLPRPALGSPSPVTVAGASRVVAGDFNQDGIMDLAVLTTAAATSSSVTILIGDGTTFTANGPPAALAAVATAIAVGDADGDGVPDLAAVGGGFLTILENDGSGNFPMLLGREINGSEEDGVAFVDLDGDGRNELAVTNTTHVVIFRQVEGSFGEFEDVALGPDAVRVVGGDLDGDGRPDLAVTQASGHLAVVPGIGNLELGSPTFTTVGNGAESLAIGDLDGDGVADVVVGSTVAEEVTVILGGKPTSIAVGETPTDVALLDLDGDGDQDIAVTVAGGRVVLLVNDGAGNFTLSNVRVTLGGDGSGMTPVYVDADTLPDLAVAETNADRVEILRGAGQTEECDGSPGCTQFCTIPAGTPLWGKALGGPGADVATDVATDPAGNVYVVGIFSGTATLGGGAPVTATGADDIFVASFTSDGTFRWRTTFGGRLEDSVQVVAYDRIAGEVVIGGLSGGATFGATTILSQHAYIARLNPATGAANGAFDPLGANAQGEVQTVAVDAAGRLFAGGAFSGSVNSDAGAFSGDGGWWTVIADGAESFIQSFTSNDTNRVARIVTDERGPILLVAYAQTVVELDDFSQLPAIFVSRYTPFGAPLWRRDIRSDADPGVVPGDLAVDPLGRTVAFAQFSGTIANGENPVTADGQSSGLLIGLTENGGGNTFVKVGGSANGLGTDRRGDFFVSNDQGILGRQFDLITSRFADPQNGLRAHRFAFGPHGEMYIAGRLVAPTPIGGSTLTPTGDSDALVARIHP